MYRRGRHLHGTKVIAVEVLHGDAQEEIAFGRRTNLLVVEEAVNDGFFNLVARTIHMNGVAHGINKITVGVEHKDHELEVGIYPTLRGAEEINVGGFYDIIDAVAAIGP